MSEYRGIYGAAVKGQSSSTGTIEGQIWYDNSIAAFKLQAFNPGTWSTGGTMPSARKANKGCGLQTAAITVGGNTPSGPPYSTNTTFEYDGTSWTSGGNVAAVVENPGVLGIETAAVCFGGGNSAGPPPLYNTTQHYDGSSWTTVPATLPSARKAMTTGMGIQTAGLSVGGNDGSNLQETLEYNGSAWTSGGNLSAATQTAGGSGLLTAALNFGGQNPSITGVTEEYDGTSWTASNSLNTARDQIGSGTNATQSASVAFAGGPSIPGLGNETELYDGTSWSNSTNMSTARKALGGAGTQAAALAFGGYGSTPLPGNESDATEEFLYGVETKTLSTT